MIDYWLFPLSTNYKHSTTPVKTGQEVKGGLILLTFTLVLLS